ncbi:MAG: hypothetical protein JW709_07115 [Sedimentisphaerales bacterium]|nr:hypothetical protein [Sedimentisphaerales bacterium]
MSQSSIFTKIYGLPHWKVVARPTGEYLTRIHSPKQAFETIERVKVRFGGWQYPFLSENIGEQIRDSKFIGYEYDGGDIIEAWRLYYSGQFYHVFPSWERVDEELKKHTVEWVLRGEAVDVSSIGIIKIDYVVTILNAIFEFTKRLCQTDIYHEGMEITIQLRNIENYYLTTTFPRFWHGSYQASTNEITLTWNKTPAEIIAVGSDLAIDGMIKIFEFFEWDNPSREIFVKEQEEFLAKLR